jgi:hypothetical protein
MSANHVLGAAILLLLALILLSQYRASRAFARQSAHLAESLASLKAGTERGSDMTAKQMVEVMGLLANLKIDLEVSEQRAQRNLVQLSDSLRDAMADFNRRILGGFEQGLDRLAAIAERSGEIANKHRHEQMEAMHHARRTADRMDASAREFGRLMADSSELLGLAAQVRESLSLLGPRQEAIDTDILRQSKSVDSMVEAVEALRVVFNETAETLLAQTRRALDAMAQRQAQGGAALQKDMNDTLGKAMAGLAKQLATAAPLSQQAKRPLDAGRGVR